MGEAAATAERRFPALVAFDLDYTLWDLYIDIHVTGPFRRVGDAINSVLDRDGQEIYFYPDVPGILHQLQADITVAACSRTSAPVLAREALLLLLMPPSDNRPVMKAIEFFDELEIYPGSKLTHFRKLHQKTGIPYTDMLFFDDELRNKDVEALGVTFQYVPEGLNRALFEQGVAEWRMRNGVAVEEAEE